MLVETENNKLLKVGTLIVIIIVYFEIFNIKKNLITIKIQKKK